MSLEGYSQKESVIIVYTGEGKGKTSASVGLMARALGTDWKVAYIQFIKHWDVGEHNFVKKISGVFGDNLMLFKGGKGFYNAGDLSAKDISKQEHIDAALETLKVAVEASTSGEYNLVICDEINNAVNDGLLKVSDLKKLMLNKHPKTSLCVTGRDFPNELLEYADIATNMTKLKHHFDDKFLANKGIDY